MRLDDNIKYQLLTGLVFWALAILFLLLASCGYAPEQKEEPAEESVSETLTVRGSVTSAFQVVVDSLVYQDMESYYGSELMALPAKVEAAGYEGYTAALEAELGFKDLTNGMTVYVQTKDRRGYQGKTIVAKDDTFSLSLPSDAAGDYQIRANKRIGITLRKGKDLKKLCYNFSAVDLDVPFDEADKPVVLSSFKTSLTLYACVVEQPAPTLPIPALDTSAKNDSSSYQTSKPANLLIFLEPVPFGNGDLISFVPGGELRTYRSAEVCTEAPCQVLVNDKGEAFWFDGVKPELVDLSAGWFASKADALKALDDWKENE